MNKITAFFMFVFIAGSLIGLSMEGSTISRTYLMADLSKTGDTIWVGNVDGFKEGGKDAIIAVRGGIDAVEFVKYENKFKVVGTAPDYEDGCGVSHDPPCFKGLSRAQKSPVDSSKSEAQTFNVAGVPTDRNHNIQVFDGTSMIIEDMLTWEAAVVPSSVGEIGTIQNIEKSFSPTNVLGTMSKLITWDFAFLEGDQVQFIKYLFLYPLSAGFVITMTIQVMAFVRGLIPNF